MLIIMSVSDAQKRANEKYRKENVNQTTVRFYPSEQDLWEWLGKQENKAGYIKNLIAKDMAKSGGGNGLE